MTAPKRVRKRCERCGVVAVVTERQQRCYARRFGRGSYACWGQLVRVVRHVPLALPPGHGIGWVLTDEAEASRMQQARAKTERDLARARAQVTKWTRELASAAKSLHKWEARARRLALRASMTDAELEAERAKRAARPKKVRRGMTLA